MLTFMVDWALDSKQELRFHLSPQTGIAGKIMNAITEAGFRVGAAQMFTLEKVNAEEFLEVYKGVVHEYSAMVAELISGPCLALEITAPDNAPPVAPAFRELAGPADPVSGFKWNVLCVYV